VALGYDVTVASVDRAARKKLKQEARQARKQARRESVLVQEFWNLPNMLTLGRVAIIPFFVWLTYDADPLNSMWAAIVFAAAAITDIVDGVLARRWNLVTVVGKLMDPLADKLIVMAALVMMVRLGRVAAWVVILLLARELVIGALRQIAATEGLVIAAGQEGKWKTSLQLVAIICLCVHYEHPLDLLFATYPVNYNLVGKLLLYLSTVFSIWSGANYFRAFLNVLGQRGKTQKA
jgi:CDP-diacylglycerol--glycerol-3-phosphate 3-phosphatidyltransferase